MKSCFLLLGCLLLAPLFTHAQKNFKDGYIVTTQGDTLRGNVNYQEWSQNPDKIEFKESRQATEQTFTPENIKSFAVTGLETYRSYLISISNGVTDLTNADVFADSTMHKSHVFLKVLVSGNKLSLYSYTDKVKTRYYAAEPRTTPVELLQGVVSNDDGSFRYDYKYRAQLASYVQKLNLDIATYGDKITTARYNERDLMDIVRSLNTRIDTKSAARSTGGVQFFVGAGINLSSIQFIGSFIVPSYAIGIKNMPYPILSGGFDVFANKITRSFFFRLEGMLNGGQQTTFDHIKYQQYRFVLNPQIAYNFYNTQNLKVFAALGLDLNFGSNKTSPGTSSTAASIQYNALEYEKFWFQTNVRAGVQLNKRFDIFAAYLFPTQVTNYTILNIRSRGVEAGAHYFFGK